MSCALEVIGFCQAAGIDVAVIGPEAPLVSGLADDLKKEGILAFGPSREAAQLEGSKSFMKAASDTLEGLWCDVLM